MMSFISLRRSIRWSESHTSTWASIMTCPKLRDISNWLKNLDKILIKAVDNEASLGLLAVSGCRERLRDPQGYQNTSLPVTRYTCNATLTVWTIVPGFSLKTSRKVQEGSRNRWPRTHNCQSPVMYHQLSKPLQVSLSDSHLQAFGEDPKAFL